MRSWSVGAKTDGDEEKRIRKLLEEAERDARELERLRRNCKFVEEVPSIPATYPRCTHPENESGVCRDLEDCPLHRKGYTG